MEHLGDIAGGRILLARGDITEFEGHAIVNAANSSLLGGGGVDGAIHSAGGPAILEACREIRAATWPDGLPAGRAVLTVSGRLAAGAVIHTVGPVWRGGSRGESGILASCYHSCLLLASARGFASIAFPAISTGAYGYPKDGAARVAFAAISEFLAQSELPKTVTLVFSSQADAAIFHAATL